MLNAQELQAVKEKSYQFLVAAYLLSEDNWRAGLSFRMVLEKLGWAFDDYDRIEDFLKVEGFMKRYTAGGVDGNFCVTFDGIVEVERLVMDDVIVAKITDDAAPEREKEMNLKEKVRDKQENRDEFLQQVYEACGGSPQKMVSIRPIAETMGLTEEEAYGLEQYLEGAYFLERKTGGGWDGYVVMTEWGVRQIQHLLLYPEQSDSGVKIKQKRGPNLDTQEKLKQLRQVREENKVSEAVTINWINACELVGIRPETVKNHDPELRARWYDPNY